MVVIVDIRVYGHHIQDVQIFCHFEIYLSKLQIPLNLVENIVYHLTILL